MHQSISRTIAIIINMLLTSEGYYLRILPYDPDKFVTELIDQEHIGWKHTMKEKVSKRWQAFQTRLFLKIGPP